MKTLLIKPHSFVDLITNSSTEIYLHATKATRDAVIETIDALLKIGGSDLTCQDCFDVRFEYKEWDDEKEDDTIKFSDKWPKNSDYLSKITIAVIPRRNDSMLVEVEKGISKIFSTLETGETFN